MPEAFVKGRQLANLFFSKSPTEDDKTWICLCGVQIKQKGSGYTNLCNHINALHPEAGLHARKESTKEELVSLISGRINWSSEANNLTGWLKMIVNCLQPSEICDTQAFQRISMLEPVSTERADVFLKKMTSAVQKKLKAQLRDKPVCLAIDSLRIDGVEWIALFASYSSTGDGAVKKALLQFQPELLHEHHSFDDVEKFVHIILNGYEIFSKNVVALVGKKFLYAEHLCQKFRWNFISCWTNRFNTAIDTAMPQILGDSIIEVSNIAAKMSQVEQILIRDNLTRSWDSSVTSCALISWNGILEMLQEYKTIVERRLPGLKAIWRTQPGRLRMETISNCIRELLEVQKALTVIERPNTSLEMCRAIFEELLSRYPRLGKELSEIPTFDENAFETGVQKIAQNRIVFMSMAERDATECLLSSGFKCRSETGSSTSEESNSYEFQALKRIRLSYVPCKADFTHLRIVSPSSNLFSKVVYPSDVALSGGSRVFELSDEQIFLRANESYWNTFDVQEELKKSKNYNMTAEWRPRNEPPLQEKNK